LKRTEVKEEGGGGVTSEISASKLVFGEGAVVVVVWV